MRAMKAPSDPQLDSIRVPPHSIEAEQSVLGGLMLDNDAWDNIVVELAEEDFYRSEHRVIFRGGLEFNGFNLQRREPERIAQVQVFIPLGVAPSNVGL